MVIEQIESKAPRSKDSEGLDAPDPIRSDSVSRFHRRRRSPLRWNVNTLMVAYVILAATIIVALRVKNDLVVALTALFGLVVIWGFSTFQARKAADEDPEEEFREYLDLISSFTQTSQAPRADPPTHLSSPLTERELGVLEEIAEGKSNKQVANALFISEQTVKNHLKHIYEKLGVRDRTSATLLAMHNGWIGMGNEAQDK